MRARGTQHHGSRKAHSLSHTLPTTAALRRGTLLDDRRAVTALEYGIVAAFLCLSLLAVFSKFGGVLSTMFSLTASGI